MRLLCPYAPTIPPGPPTTPTIPPWQPPSRILVFADALTLWMGLDLAAVFICF